VDELAGFDESEPGETAPRPFLTGEENDEIVRALRAVIARHQGPGFEIHAAGTPVMVEHLQRMMRADMARFTGLAVLAIAAFLAALFRSAAGVILPLVVVTLTLVCTLAIMAASGVPIMLPTQILPSFLLAVGVGASVHVLAIFFQGRSRGLGREDAIAAALGHSGLPIVMTSLTTAGGLFSFSVAELAPISHLGIFGPAGILVSLVLTIVLLPALVAVFPIAPPSSGPAREPRSQRILVRTGELATARALPIVAVCAALVVAAIAGTTRIGFSHSPNEWLPEDDEFRVANELVNEELEGAASVELVLDSGRENGLHEPALLRRMDELQLFAGSVRSGSVRVGKTVSLVDVTKEIHRALNENRSAFYAIPDRRELVAQELLLFENSGSDDLEDLVDSRFQLARMTLKVPFQDAIDYVPFLELLNENTERILGEEVDVTVTGIISVLGRTISAVVSTLARSYVVALAVITPLMILLIGNLRIGLLAMIPNLFPILLTLGLMGWVGLPMDAFTLMVGSIAIGLAVDDTIHFMHNFRRYHERSGDVREAVRETLRTTGQALLFTSLVLSTGFFLFGLASMENLVAFGMLTGFTTARGRAAPRTAGPGRITGRRGASHGARHHGTRGRARRRRPRHPGHSDDPDRQARLPAQAYDPLLSHGPG
jgi:predicted RND superfamily exporter protein